MWGYCLSFPVLYCQTVGGRGYSSYRLILQARTALTRVLGTAPSWVCEQSSLVDGEALNACYQYSTIPAQDIPMTQQR